MNSKKQHNKLKSRKELLSLSSASTKEELSNCESYAQIKKNIITDDIIIESKIE